MDAAVVQVADAHRRLLKKNGAQAAPGNCQYELKLVALLNREKQFVDDLSGFAQLIERFVADESKATAASRVE